MAKTKAEFRVVVMRTDMPIDNMGTMISVEAMREVAYEKGWKVELVPDQGPRENFQLVANVPVKLVF